MTGGPVFTIPPGAPFVDALACGLLSRFRDRDDPATPTRILLPTRRACRALTMAFLRQSGGAPLLLPRLSAIGDVDEDELTLEGGVDVAADAVLDLPPPMAPLKRQLLLTKLVRASQPSMPVDQAARLAAALARLLDQVQTAGADFADLDKLAPNHLARHWQVTLDFLRIVIEYWPRILADEGRSDPADYRNRLLAAQIAAWRRAPPAAPVIAAGSTGSIPATADLLAAVAGLPTGIVILPGLDTESDDATWEAIRGDPSHPQYGMAHVLDRLGIERAAVRPWPESPAAASTAGRVSVLHAALRPAECADFTAARRLARDGADFARLRRIDAPGPDEEARVIALILRQTLEHPGKTAALVTPDRALARRVAAELRRWAINVDDSGGQPLANTIPGTFLRGITKAVAEKFAPVPLLAILKHPLTAAGLPRLELLGQVRRLEKALLRGPRPAPGLAGLRAACFEDGSAFGKLIDRLEERFAPLLTVLESPGPTLDRLITAHVAVAEGLAATPTERGTDRVWHGDAGEALTAFIADIAASAPALGVIAGAAYADLLDALIAEQVVRPKQGGHPRLAIWGPLEARLQHADVMILGGLNEDVWPPAARANPWMSRPMMRQFGLALPERRIGLSAHDFAQACAAPEVWLTRAERRDGTPTTPSRWLLRLEAVLADSSWQRENAAVARQWLAWQEALDRPAGEATPIKRPEPRPPVEMRPRRLSVTEIETWMRDPYAVYARHILKLKALDELDADAGAAERGSFIHTALDRFVSRHPDALPTDPLAELLAIGEEALGPLGRRPVVRTFWWPRFEKIAAWFIDQEQNRRQRLRTSLAEISGETRFVGPEGVFVLTAKADRIDLTKDGALEIIDYKTGALPKADDVNLGFAPQLPLEAVIAEDGGFPNVPGGPVTALQYWKLAGDVQRNEIQPAGGKKSVPDDLASAAREGMARLVAAYDDPLTPYPSRPRPAFAPRYGDYTHLARVKEWSGGGEEEA